MPLIISVQADGGTWLEICQVLPGDPAYSVSHHRDDGAQEIYVFGCDSDDRTSRLLVTCDAAIHESDALSRLLLDGNYELVRLLGDGDELERVFRTDTSPQPRRLRFRHIHVDFGERACLICHRSVPTPDYIRHVTREHDARAISRWPGGLPGLAMSLRRTVAESIDVADGFPGLQSRLRESFEALDRHFPGLN